MPKQVFLARFELVVARFGLENGLFWGKKWVTNGSKMCFLKVILDHLGCLNK